MVTQHRSLGLCDEMFGGFHMHREARSSLQARLLHHLLPFSQDPSEKYGWARRVGERRFAEKKLGFPLNFELSPILVTQQQRPHPVI